MMRTLLITLTLSFSLALAQADLPDTSAGRWFGDFLRLYNNRDIVGLERFADERIGEEMLAMLGGAQNAAQQLMTIYSGMGPLEVISVEGGEMLTVYTHGTLTGGWLAFHLNMQDDQKLARMNFNIDERPQDAPRLEPVTTERLSMAVEEYLENLVTHDLFSGVVLVAQDGETLYSGAFGQANLAGEPITLDTGFALGSMSKMFTAVALLQLVEAGDLSLDDPVSLHLPDYPAELIEGVTVQHLLTHGSGLGSFDFAEIQAMRTVSEMLALKVDPPAFTPGTRFRYSNMGYILLGAIIESVSGQDYYNYVQEHILIPAGMMRTGAYDLEGEQPTIATGFLSFSQDGSRPDNLALRVHRGSPAGDFVATASDLLRYSEALLGGQLLGEALLEQAMTPQRVMFTQPGVTIAYGYGMEVKTINGVTSVGHGGGAPGESTAFTLYPEAGNTIIVLSNYDVIADIVSRHLTEMLGFR